MDLLQIFRNYFLWSLYLLVLPLSVCLSFKILDRTSPRKQKGSGSRLRLLRSISYLFIYRQLFRQIDWHRLYWVRSRGLKTLRVYITHMGYYIIWIIKHREKNWIFSGIVYNYIMLLIFIVFNVIKIKLNNRSLWKLYWALGGGGG